MLEYTRLVTLTTHPNQICLDQSLLLAELLMDVLSGASKEDMISRRRPELGHIQQKPPEEIDGTGYAPESLEAAIWVILTTDTFRDAILAAINVSKHNLMLQSCLNGAIELQSG